MVSFSRPLVTEPHLSLAFVCISVVARYLVDKENVHYVVATGNLPFMYTTSSGASMS